MKKKKKIYREKGTTTVVYRNGRRSETYRLAKSDFERWFAPFSLYKKAMIILFVVITTSYTFVAMQTKALEPKEVVRTVEVIDNSLPPVLQAIAKAESHNSHYCTAELVRVKFCAPSEQGQVLVVANKNGTIDVGKYAINQWHHGKKAADMGLNIYDEQDNEAYAIHLFMTEGTVPWKASQAKWGK